jgi:hypothetical protein
MQIERLSATLARSFEAFRSFTTLTRLQLEGVPLGSTVKATCKFKKKKCPKKARRGKEPSVSDRCLPPGARRPVAC